MTTKNVSFQEKVLSHGLHLGNESAVILKIQETLFQEENYLLLSRNM